jgi:hypothetical protein
MNSANEKTGTLWYFLGGGLLLDDSVDQLADFGFQPDFSALPADQGRHVLKFIEFVAPGLGVGDSLALQGPSALSAGG